MNQDHEWPLGKRPAEGAAGAASAPFAPSAIAADDAAPLLPLAFNEHVELVRSSRAVEAFCRRRAGQLLNSGHTPETDLDKPIGHIARHARYPLTALLEIIGPARMNLPPGRRTDCLKYIESAGATLIALWERCQVEVDDE